MKRTLLILVWIATQLFVADLLSAYVLFYRNPVPAAGEDRGGLAVSRAARELRSAISRRIGAEEERPAPAAGACFPHATPGPFYQADALYGYYPKPGRYQLTYCPTETTPNKPYEFVMTIEPDQSRLVSHKASSARRQILLFGDSWVQGWGLNDEQTAAFQLQDFFRDEYRVKNHGHVSHTASLLKFRTLRDQLGQGDVVIIGYAPYYLERNVAAPSRVNTEALWSRKNFGAGRNLLHPRARLDSGRLEIDYVGLEPCEETGGRCLTPDPPLDIQVQVAQAILQEFLATRGPTFALLQLEGLDDDPVVRLMRDKGVPIIDVREETSDIFMEDEISGYNGHPGAMRNFYYYSRIRDFVLGLR